MRLGIVSDIHDAVEPLKHRVIPLTSGSAVASLPRESRLRPEPASDRCEAIRSSETTHGGQHMHGITTRRDDARMRRASWALALVLASAFAVAVQAPRAAAQGRVLALNAFGGYYIASDLYNDNSSYASLEMKNSFEWGGRLTMFTSRYSAAEFAYTRVGSDLHLRTGNGSAFPAGFDAGHINGDQYDLNFLFSQPTPNPNMWPYFTLGFGWTVTHPETPKTTINGKSLFGFNFGIGTMYNINPKFALRLDGRWRVTDTAITTSSGYYCDYWGYCWSYASDWYNSGELTAGLTYRITPH